MIRRMSRRRRLVSVAVAIVIVAVLWALADGRPTWDRAVILDAIRMVESSDRPNPPDGDDGRAIGPYQIHEVYWRDATQFDPSLGGTYQDCRDRAYAERVIDAYMRRWVPDAWAAGDAEVIARTHNGGPEGAQKDSTLRYWEKVRSHLR